jgi:glutamate racemase
MPTTSQPIGVFDSGVGGLTMLEGCLEALPAEDFVYVGDSAYFPYGDRPPDEVRRRALAIGRWLVGQGVKLVVVACNTATAVALADLQRELAVPVIGVIRPEVLAAVRATHNRRIGLLATEATVRSHSYPRLVHRHDAGVEMTSVACPLLAPVIQRGDSLDEADEEMVARYAAPLTAAGVDTVILGCTHFPLAGRLLQRVLPGVTLIDGRREMGLEVIATLERRGLLRAPGPEGGCRFVCSGDPESFRALGTRFLHVPLGAVEVLDLESRDE